MHSPTSPSWGEEAAMMMLMAGEGEGDRVREEVRRRNAAEVGEEGSETVVVVVADGTGAAPEAQRK